MKNFILAFILVYAIIFLITFGIACFVTWIASLAFGFEFKLIYAVFGALIFTLLKGLFSGGSNG